MNDLLNPLNPGERRVAARAAHGRTNKEIAAELGLSPKTVAWTLSRVYRRLGLRSRTELAALCEARSDDLGPKVLQTGRSAHCQEGPAR